jgi:hypothetical protein
MSASTPTVATKQQANSSADEWETRVQLAACYRIFDMLGWTEMIFNHISLRVPGPDRHFLINPFGLWYREVTASNLVKVDIEGNRVGSSQGPSTALDSSFTRPSMRREGMRTASWVSDATVHCEPSLLAGFDQLFDRLILLASKT